MILKLTSYLNYITQNISYNDHYFLILISSMLKTSKKIILYILLRYRIPLQYHTLK